jgi:hypothetical protein
MCLPGGLNFDKGIHAFPRVDMLVCAMHRNYSGLHDSLGGVMSAPAHTRD